MKNKNMMRRMIKFISIPAMGCLFLFSSLQGKAQVDAHFSQYYAYPLWLNPAMTGVMDGDFRLSANYRRQWASVSAPFSTGGFSGDMYPFKHFAVGFTVLNQAAGDGGYNYTNAVFSAAYHAELDPAGMNVLSVGLQAGIINRRFDPSKLEFGSQYNPILGFDPTLPSGENFSKTSASSFDANFGILYYNGNPNNIWNPFVGAALYHLTQPEDPFLGKGNGKLPMRFDMQAGTRIKLSETVDLTPHIVYIQQGNADEVSPGVYMSYKLEGNSDFLLGATYRVNDAFIPTVGIHYNEFTFGFSYDVNTSALRTASEGKGGFELSISYIMRKKVTDPKFICPRL